MLRECLHIIFAGLNPLQAEVFVVDNASSDGTLAMLAREFPKVIAKANTRNLGFAAANNVALARAAGRHVLLLNTDTLVHGTVLPDGVALLDSHADVAVMGPRILNRDGTMQASSTRFSILRNLTLQTLGLTRLALFDVHRMENWDRTGTREVEVVSGCAMFVRAAALRQVGPMDDAFFFLGEETERCRRFAKARWKVVFALVGEVTHFGGGSVKSLNHMRDIMLTEGTVRLHRKHGGALWRGPRAKPSGLVQPFTQRGVVCAGVDGRGRSQGPGRTFPARHGAFWQGMAQARRGADMKVLLIAPNVDGPDVG